jgi:hypothetical protein
VHESARLTVGGGGTTALCVCVCVCVCDSCPLPLPESPPLFVADPEVSALVVFRAMEALHLPPSAQGAVALALRGASCVQRSELATLLHCVELPDGTMEQLLHAVVRSSVAHFHCWQEPAECPRPCPCPCPSAPSARPLLNPTSLHPTPYPLPGEPLTVITDQAQARRSRAVLSTNVGKW